MVWKQTEVLTATQTYLRHVKTLWTALKSCVTHQKGNNTQDQCWPSWSSESGWGYSYIHVRSGALSALEEDGSGGFIPRESEPASSRSHLLSGQRRPAARTTVRRRKTSSTESEILSKLVSSELHKEHTRCSALFIHRNCLGGYGFLRSVTQKPLKWFP